MKHLIKPTNRFVVLLAIPVVVLWSVIGSFQIFEFVSIDRRDPIVRWVDASASNSPVSAGERLLVLIEREKIRNDCTVESRRKVVNQDGRPAVLDGDVHAGGAVGAATEWAYPTEHLPPGDYVLYVKLTYVCPDNQKFYHDQPDVRFRVVE